MVDFRLKKTLLGGFILLGYTDILNKRTYDLVGVDQDRRKFQGYSYSIDEKAYKKEFEYSHTSNVHLVIPADFTGEGSVSYVLVTREGDGRYSNWIYFRDDNKKENLGESTAVPLLYADAEDLRPQLLIQRSGSLERVRIGKDRSVTRDTVNEYGRLHKDHSSAFVDVDGSMKACLCLVVVGERSDKMLKILSNKREGFTECFTMDLPENIGPLVFDDFNGDGMNDMAFVQKENGEHFLKIYLNTNSRIKDAKQKRRSAGFLLQDPSTRIFSDAKVVVANLSEMFPDFEPVLSSKDFGGIQCGIFTADLRAKGKPDIFLSMKNKDGNTRVVALENQSTLEAVKFGTPSYGKDLSEVTNIISMSCCDYNNTGREAIFLNRVEGGSPSLEAYENDLSKENLKLSLSTILPEVEKQMYGSGIPGVSYLVSCEGGKRIILSSQMSYSTFVHLKHPSAYIGLGTMSLIIDGLVVGVPGHDAYNELYVMDSIAIPNSDLIVYIRKNGNYSVESHFVIGDHFRTIICVLLTVAGVNLVFILLLQYRDRRRVVKAKNLDKLHPLFSTLQ